MSCRGKLPRAQGKLHTYEMVTEPFADPNLFVSCCEMPGFRDCGVRHNVHAFSLYRNLDLEDRIFEVY